MIELPFENREEAGRSLAQALSRFAETDALVLAIPRGGVPIGRIVADALNAELDIVLVRKLGAPGNPELAIGAIDERGRVIREEELADWDVDPGYLQREAKHQLAVIRERRARYGRHRPLPEITGRTVIVVDDGLATGATMIAALKAVAADRPRNLICAVPVAASDSLRNVSKFADEVVCLATPEPFMAVGRFYRDFHAVEDAEVIRLLAQRSGKT